MRTLFWELLDRFDARALITADGIENGPDARLGRIGDKEWVEEWRQCPLQGGTSWWHISVQGAEGCGSQTCWNFDMDGIGSSLGPSCSCPCCPSPTQPMSHLAETSLHSQLHSQNLTNLGFPLFRSLRPPTMVSWSHRGTNAKQLVASDLHLLSSTATASSGEDVTSKYLFPTCTQMHLA